MSEDDICERCGCCSVAWEPCEQCGGEGAHDLYDDDPIAYAPGETERCEWCKGRGVYDWCIGRCDSTGTHAEQLKFEATA